MFSLLKNNCRVMHSVQRGSGALLQSKFQKGATASNLRHSIAVDHLSPFPSNLGSDRLYSTDYTDGYHQHRLLRSKYISPDTKLLTFELPWDESIHLRPHAPGGVKIRATVGEQEHEKSYSVASHPELTGMFDLIVKEYPGEGLGQYLCSLRSGDEVSLWAKPRARFEYEANKYDDVGLICNGTGLAPLYQVLCMALADREDKTRIHLIFANRTEEDILMKMVMDFQAFIKKPRLLIHYILSEPSSDWKGGTGHVDIHTLEEHLPPPSDTTKVLVCGSDGFVELVAGDRKDLTVGGLLGQLGYSDKMVSKL